LWQALSIEALGAGLYVPALSTLRRIARSAGHDAHLRRRAVVALGRLDHPDAAAALISITADPGTPIALRAAAATALPTFLSNDERISLRHALRGDRIPPELTAAVARALARAGEREALTPLIRSAQNDSGAEALASIEAMADLGDQSVAPILVRISQSPLAAPGVKLAAIAALLRLGGAEYESLLREYLAAPSPPLRTQAHAALAAAFPADPRLGAPLADPGAPLALRLQALMHLGTHNPDSALISAVVAAPDEHPQVRLAAAHILARATRDEAVTSLAAPLTAAEDDVDPPPPMLRRRCLQALGVLTVGRGPAAEAARAQLGAIITDPDQPVEHHHWATEALLAC
jgi:HEAT repeat protein